MAVLDLSKVSSHNYLPEGETACVIVKIESKVSKEKSSPMEAITFRDRLGREDTQFFVLTEKALFRIKGLAIASGFDPEKTDWSRFDTRSMGGRLVLVVKTKKGMRQIQTDVGPKDVPDYEYNYGRVRGSHIEAGAAPATAAANTDDIPF